MATKKELTKEDRINKEFRKLKRTFKMLSKDSLIVAEGLMKRAAFMRVTLEDMELDLDENGFVEMFSQSDKTDPYERERPVARLYNTMNKNYQSIMKQLAEYVPKPDPKKHEGDDGFDSFVASR